MRELAGIPDNAFARWWYRIWSRFTFAGATQGGVCWQTILQFLNFAWLHQRWQLRRRCRALQLRSCFKFSDRALTCHLHSREQCSEPTLSHITQAEATQLRRYQCYNRSSNVERHSLAALPRIPKQLRHKEAEHQPGSLPTPAFLDARPGPTHQSWGHKVRKAWCPTSGPTDVRFS